MRLSERLRMVADMVPKCRTIADVGCDHGYLSVWLLRENRADYAIAMDVRTGPLAKAGETISFFHQTSRAETRLSDGLTELKPGEADCIVCAGMGGELISRILDNGKACIDTVNTLILQPQSDQELVRRTVYRLGFRIEDERCLTELGKFYICMRAVRATDCVPMPEDAEFRYGTALVARKDIEYLGWLTAECEKKTAMVQQLMRAGTTAAGERLAGAAEELEMLSDTIRKML